MFTVSFLCVQAWAECWGDTDALSCHDTCLPGDHGLGRDESCFENDWQVLWWQTPGCFGNSTGRLVTSSFLLLRGAWFLCVLFQFPGGWKPRAWIYIAAAIFFFSNVYDFEAAVIFTGVRIATLCSFNVFMMCGGYFRDVINSSEREGFCDWMFRQVALFLQLVLVCQKMAHLIIFTDYITSKSTNISRTLKIKSKFLHINRKWQSNRQYTFHWYIQLSFTLSNFLKTTSLGP